MASETWPEAVAIASIAKGSRLVAGVMLFATASLLVVTYPEFGRAEPRRISFSRITSLQTANTHGCGNQETGRRIR
jgi:hypothetical protein